MAEETEEGTGPSASSASLGQLDRGENKRAGADTADDNDKPAGTSARRNAQLPTYARPDAETFDEKLRALPTIDQLDVKLRETLAGCPSCRNLKGLKATAMYAKDPSMFQHLLK